MLIVTHHFADYKPGDSITDASVIAEILKTENAVRVVKVTEEARVSDRGVGERK